MNKKIFFPGVFGVKKEGLIKMFINFLGLIFLIKKLKKENYHTWRDNHHFLNKIVRKKMICSCTF